jgi:hypothetical protein
MSLSLKEMQADRDSLLEQDRFRCQRCLKTEPLPESGVPRLCSACSQFDADRAEAARNAILGGLSSSPEFEAREFRYGVIDNRGAIGLRSDVRWYKKAGSNGDG